MKNYLHLFFIIPLMIVLLNFKSSVINAQEFKVVSFKHLDGNTTARVNRRRDVNGQNCAVVIIKHNFNDFTVESGKGYENLEEKTGETCVWLSPDEYQIVIRKAGYIPLQYSLKDKIKELETYELVVTDEFGSIQVKAPDAQIWLDDKAVAKDEYTFRLKEGRYIIKATRDKYYPQEKFTSLNAGDNIELNLDLKPIMGELNIISESSKFIGANIYIDGKLNNLKTNASIPILIGEHNVKIIKEDYSSYSQMINIYSDQSTIIKYSLLPEPQLELKNIQNKIAGIYFLRFVVFSGFAGIATYGTMRYNEYYYGKWAPVVIVGLLGAVFVPFAIKYNKLSDYKQRKRELKNQLSFNVVSVNESIGLELTYNF